MFNKILSYISHDIAIDLGTANSLVYVKGKGIVISEPSVVAVNQKTGRVLAIGNEAKKMVGRTPGNIVATRPLVKGVISDFEVTEQMLKYFLNKVRKEKFMMGFPPRVIIGVPCGVTEVERKAVQDAAKSAGARQVFLIEQPMAAAIGARLQVQEAGGNFIVDIGGGTTEIAVISLGGLVISKSLRIAGDKLNQDIIYFAQEEYKLLVGERTAENVKIGIGSAYPLNLIKDENDFSSFAEDKKKIKNKNKEEQEFTKTKNKLEMPIRGRNLVTGLPEEITVNDTDIRRALEKSVKQIVQAVKNTIEETPPELLADIMSSGIYLAGGGSLLRGLDALITKETKIPCKIIDDPLTAVARGAGMVLENLDELEEVLVETEELEVPK
ncbi:MAG: rod shape-determining protein [Patescibacteria group bacterium]|nr:rod shape-determining protein [Patescibacteria group bacterium]